MTLPPMANVRRREVRRGAGAGGATEQAPGHVGGEPGVECEGGEHRGKFVSQFPKGVVRGRQGGQKHP